MSKHTPGPWAVHGLDVRDDGESLIARVSWRRDEEQEPFNAHLIAAAPELLEALIECERYGGGYTNCDQSYLPPTVRAQIQTALDKARGEP